MALALYRKYRPRTFAEIIGQEHVTEPLSVALRTGRLNHAYLFSGPRGCGKTSSARILARSLNCEKGPTPDPCGECGSCVALAPDGSGSIDVIEIDAASHGGVDDARELRERAFFAPVSSRFKVYVIDEAHMVSSAGFNALLKLVEEPPEYVKFVFATTEPEKVLGTIKSRTHHYPFRLIPPGVLRPYLEQLCQSEGVAVEPAVFPLVVRAGGGSARDSLSVLDQLIAGAGPQGVTYARAVALLGVTDAGLLDEMCDGLAAADGAAMFAAIDRVMEAGHDPRRFASDLLERLRDLIIFQQVPDAVAKGLFDYPADQVERLTAQAGHLGAATLTRCAGIVHDGLTEMRGTTAPRLLLELITARMLLPGADESSAALLQRLERLERRMGTAAVPTSAPPAAAPSVDLPPPPGVRPTQPQSAEAILAPAPTPAVAEQARPAVAAPAVTANEPEASEPEPPAPMAQAGPIDAPQWDEVLVTVRRQSQKAWAVVREATVRAVEGDTLVLVFQHQVHATMFGANTKILTDAVGHVLGGTWQVRWELGGGGPGERPATNATRPAPPQPTPPQPTPPQPAAQQAGRRPGQAEQTGAAQHDAAGQAGAAPRGPAGQVGSSRAGSAPHGMTEQDGPSAPDSTARQVRSAQAGSSQHGPAQHGPAPTAGPRSAGAQQQPGPISAQSAPHGPDRATATRPQRPVREVSPVSERAASPSASPADGRDDEEWPTAAVPGGGPPAQAERPPAPDQRRSVAGGAPPAAVRSATSSPAAQTPQASSPAGRLSGATAVQAAPPAATMRTATRPAAPESGLAAARAAARSAAAAGRSTTTATRAAAAPVAAPSGPGWDEEPPYDPDYDGAVRDPQYPGFDPGDEPLDDDQPASRESSEEQAIRLLREHLGAERID